MTATYPGQEHIRPGQTWTSARPYEVTTVRVTRVGPGRVEVVDAHDGKRSRSILAKVFHASPTTKTGRPHKSGYVLVTDSQEGPAK